MTEKTYNLYNLEPQFKNFLIAENFSTISLKNYLSDFRHFSGWLELYVKSHNIKFSDSNRFQLITPELISQYRSYLIVNNLPHKTINRRLSTVRKFCSFCISQGWMKENPAKKISNISHLQPKVNNHQNNKALESPKDIVSSIKYQVLSIFKKIINQPSRQSFRSLSPANYQPQSNNFGFQQYIAFLIILVFVATLGAGIYNQFFSKSEKTFAYPTAPVRAGRILSFQGRLTDTLGNPITTATNVTFKLYNVSTGGTALYTAGACSITPDQDGIFNVLIGGQGYSPTPPQQVCGTEIPSSIFTENANVYLGITVASDSEMTPRQQIANVGYAINAETLQGLPPGSNPSNIPFINQDGNLLIAASTPGIRSTFTSADFTLSSAKAAVIQSAGTGDVILQATESGTLKFRTGGDSDAFNRMIIDNNGLVGIGLTPSQKLEVSGNIYANSGQIRLGNFASAPTAIGAGSMYYDSTTAKVYYYNGSAWTEMGAGGGGGSSWWTENLGLLYPINSTLDLAIGGTATSSAKFAFTNINYGTPTLKFNQSSAFDLPNSTVNALNIEGGLLSFDTQNSRVGIGTNTPIGKLHIEGANTGKALAIFDETGNQDILTASASGTTKFRMARDGEFYASGGLNASNGSYYLNSSGVLNASYFTDAQNNNYGIDPAGTTNFGGYSLKITGGALLAADSGNIGIGTTNPQHKLDVNGNVRIQGGELLLNPISSATNNTEGTIYYDSDTNHLFVYGDFGGSPAWHRLSMDMTKYSSSSANIANQNYIEIAHNQNTNDLSLTGWVYDTVSGLWKKITDWASTIVHNLDNQFNPPFTQKKKVSQVQIQYNENDFGTGADGSITVSSNTSINTTNLISGRSCADGGDAVNYSVTALTSNTATLESAPSSGCLAVGDEVLLINLQGTQGSVVNVGNFETLRIQSISGKVVTFTTSKTKYYGDGATDDSNLGTGVNNQKVMLQRVPNYTDVTVNSGANFYPDAYSPSTGLGGVMFFRATGTVSVAGTIHATGKGFPGGAGGVDSTSGGAPGQGLFYTSSTDGYGGYNTSPYTGNAGTYSGGGGGGKGGSATGGSGGSGTTNTGAGGGGGGGTVNRYNTSNGGIGGGGGGGGYAASGAKEEFR